MLAQNALVFPCVIAERAFRPLDEFEPLLDERSSLQCVEQRGVRLKAGPAFKDDVCLLLADSRDAGDGVARHLQVAHGGLLVELWRLVAIGYASIEFGRGLELVDRRKVERLPSLVDGTEHIGRSELINLQVQHQAPCDD